MSRFIEGRENFLWSLDSDIGKKDLIVIYVSNPSSSILGITCPHLACDAMILSQNDWKLFKKYASNSFSRLEKSGIRVKEVLVREIKPSLFQHFSRLDNNGAYFASIANDLLQKLTRTHNPIVQSTFRGRLIPKEDLRRLRKHSNPNTSSVKHFISYIKIWKSIKTDIAIREKYESNIELYNPELNILPIEIIDQIKSFLF